MRTYAVFYPDRLTLLRDPATILFVSHYGTLPRTQVTIDATTSGAVSDAGSLVGDAI